METLTSRDVRAAQARLFGRIKNTPVLRSSVLEGLLGGGHQVFFKAEALQSVGAFKARGALNTMLWLEERGAKPREVVAFSSGNHAQAVAWAGRALGIPVRLFLPRNISAVKLQASIAYGARVVLTGSRDEAEAKAEEAVAEGAALVPPFDHDQVIAGQGTAALELLEVTGPLDALFAPCGGGGLLSGTLLAAESPSIPVPVLGGEPLLANDAARTLRDGAIFRWPDSPKTIADGARTLAVSPRTLTYLRRIEGLFEISEVEMIAWTQWLTHLLKVQCEPTAALGMAAAARWLEAEEAPRRVGVILSGGNMDRDTVSAVWAQNHLERPPPRGDPLASPLG